MAARSQLRLVSELTELAAGVNVTKDEIPHNYFYPGYEEDELAQIQAALATPRPHELKRRGSSFFSNGDTLDLDPRDPQSNLDSSLLNSSTPSNAIAPSGLFRRGSVSVEDALLARDMFEASLDNTQVDEGEDPNLQSEEDNIPHSRYYKHNRATTQREGRPRLFEAGGKGDALIAFGKKSQNDEKVRRSVAYQRGSRNIQHRKENDDISELLAIMKKSEMNVNTDDKENKSELQELDLDFLPSEGESDSDLENIKLYPSSSNNNANNNQNDDVSDDLERLADESLPSFPRGASYESAPFRNNEPKNAEYPILASGRRRHRYDHYDDHLNEYFISAPKPSQPQPQGRSISGSSSRTALQKSDRVLDAPTRSRGPSQPQRVPATGMSALAYVLPAKLEEQQMQRYSAPRSSQLSTFDQEKMQSHSEQKPVTIEKRATRSAMRDIMNAISHAKEKEGSEYCAALTRALAISTPVLGTLHPMSVRISATLVGWLCAHASADFAAKQFAKSMSRLDQALSITSLVSPPTLKRVIEALDTSADQVIEAARRSYDNSMEDALWIEVRRLGIAPLIELLLSPALPVLAAARLSTLGLAATVTRSGGAIRRTLIVLRERLALHSLIIRAEKHPLVIEILLSRGGRTSNQTSAQIGEHLTRSKVLHLHRERLLKLLSFSGLAYPLRGVSSSTSLQPDPSISNEDNPIEAQRQYSEYDAEKDHYGELFQSKQNSWADIRLWRSLIGDFSEPSSKEMNAKHLDESKDGNVMGECLSREDRREIQFKASGDALESLYPAASWLQRATALCSSLAAERMCGGPLLESFVAKSLSSERGGDDGQQLSLSQDSRKVLREAREAAGAGCGAASTHLNLCAIYSTLASHDKALHHAETATSLIQQELLNVELPDNNVNSGDEASKSRTSEGVEKATRKLVRDKLTLLCVSHHNAAVELEHLRDYQSSFSAYSRAAEIARDTLSADASDITPQNRLAKQLEQAAVLAAEQVSSLIKQQEAERERKLARLGTGRSSSTLLRYNSSNSLRSSASLASNSSQAGLRSRPQSASRQGRQSSSNLNLRRNSTQR